jgi:hypothetical protein
VDVEVDPELEPLDVLDVEVDPLDPPPLDVAPEASSDPAPDAVPPEPPTDPLPPLDAEAAASPSLWGLCEEVDPHAISSETTQEPTIRDPSLDTLA